MTLTAKGVNQNKRAIDVPDKGAHVARVVALTDLGHQPAWEYQGETIKDNYKITFTYELVSSEMADGRPHWVSEDINVNDFEGDGVSSTMMLRVRAIDPNNETQDGKDLTKLINKPCLVTISHNQKGYAKVKSVSGVPNGMEVPELRNPTYVFDIDNPDMNVYENFPEFVKGKITSALNFKGSALDKLLTDEVPF